MGWSRRWIAPLFGVTVALVAPLTGAAGSNSTPYRVDVVTMTVPVDGNDATGTLYLPYRDAPGDLAVTQLVVFCHGHTDTSVTEAPYLRRVASESGAPVLAMDNRGEPGAWNPTTGWQDTVAATQWFKERHPEITETVLWGWSMGGVTSGLALAYGPPGLFDYWVASFPAVEDAGAWAAYTTLDVVDGDGKQGKEVEHDAGDCNPAQCPAAYLARTPTVLADRIRVRRALFLHALFDDSSPYEQSREMQAALIARGVPTSMYTVLTYRDGSGTVRPAGHGFGVVADEAAAVVARVLAAGEPMDGPDIEYLVDESTGVRLRI